jgi:chromosome segregation ATPase
VGAGELNEETERQLAATAAKLEQCKSAREAIERQLAATTTELEQCKSTLSSTRETTGQQLAATVAELEQCKSALSSAREENERLRSGLSQPQNGHTEVAADP